LEGSSTAAIKKELYMMRRIFISTFLLLAGLFSLLGQQKEPHLVQLSGMVLDGANEQLAPIPYVNILVLEKSRGTYSDFNGFFSLVVEVGDVIEFSAIGYESVRYRIPDTLTDNRYSIVQLMTRDIINLPETVVFPWPSREHFRLEFLAMDVSYEMDEIAATNVAEDAMQRMRSEVIRDGRENANYYLRQQTSQYYFIGQRPPMNIFSPVAWKQFFDAWKRGDYKRR
jgi:hypothetical protein